MTDFKAIAQRRLDDLREAALDLSHRIHENPEVGFAEYEAAELVARALHAEGFAVQRGVADLPTALVASYGSGELVVGLFAEYDALPDVGHACGHNIIAAAAVCAARVLAPLADELGLTVKLFGTPAEEAGGGKVLMLERGVFAGLHAAMMVHPAPGDRAAARALAVAHLEVTYTGKTAHASVAPERGINAADALTVAQVGIGLLRQHLPSDTVVHGIVTKGGEAPNIVPGHTAGRFNIRAETLSQLEKVRPRVEACFTAGAIATGCEVSIRLTGPIYSEFNSDVAMHELYQANAEKLGRNFHADPDGPTSPAASTDMANVSQVIPTIHPTIGLDCGNAVNHQPEFARYCGQQTGDQAVLDGALAMVWTVIDIATMPAQRARLIR